jgi:hypothetical protein
MEGGRYSVKPRKVCLYSRRALKRVIRRAISRSEFKEAARDNLLFRERCDLLKVVRDDKEEFEDEELESVDVFPLTFFAHLEMASSSLAAIAPMRPPAANEDEETEDAERLGSCSSRRCSSSPRYISSS